MNQARPRRRAPQGGRDVQRTRIARSAPRPAHGDLRRGVLRRRRCARRRGRQQARTIRRRRPGDRERQGWRPPRGGRLPRPERDRALPEHLADLAGRTTEGPAGRESAAGRSGRCPGDRLPRDAEPRLRLPRRQRDLPRREPQADRRQGRAGRREEDRRRPRGTARRLSGRYRARSGAGQQAGREGPAQGRAARLPNPLPALTALLPERGRRAAAADDRRPGDHRHLPAAPDRERVRVGVDLRPQPDHRSGARTGDRLQPLRRLPLSRGDREVRSRGTGNEAHAQHRGPHSALLVDHGRSGAGLADRLPAALPLLDGARRPLGRPARRIDRADGVAGRARPTGQQGQCAGPRLPAAARGARRDVHRVGLLVPALPLRDAPADRNCDGDRRDPDRARDPLLLAQVHLGGCAGAARERQRQAGRQRDARRVPAVSRHAQPAAGRACHPLVSRADQPRGLEGEGHRKGAAAAAARQRRRRDRGLFRQQLHLRPEPRRGQADPRPARRRPVPHCSSAGPRRTSSTCSTASRRMRRSPWRS